MDKKINKKSSKTEIIMRTPRVLRNNRVVQRFDVVKIGVEKAVVVPEKVRDAEVDGDIAEYSENELGCESLRVEEGNDEIFETESDVYSKFDDD